MTLPLTTRLVNFVQAEFGVSSAEVRTALHHEDSPAHLPILLWQYGFITLAQLNRLFDWLELERANLADF